VTISYSTLVSNEADHQGGAIWNHGRLTITNSTLTGNQTLPPFAVVSQLSRKEQMTQKGPGVRIPSAPPTRRCEPQV